VDFDVNVLKRAENSSVVARDCTLLFQRRWIEALALSIWCRAKSTRQDIAFCPCCSTLGVSPAIGLELAQGMRSTGTGLQGTKDRLISVR